MKTSNPVLYLFIVFLLGACQEQEAMVEEKRTTEFPTEPQQDFTADNVQARVALPDADGNARVWVKGSQSYDQVSFAGKSIQLKPPYFDSLLVVQGEKMELEFKGSKVEPETLQVFPKTGDFFTTKDPYSLIFYGCFQPFEVDSAGRPVVRTDSTQMEHKLRQAFRAIALGENVNYKGDSAHQQKSLKKPLVVLGSGDEAYADVHLHGENGESPMSAWNAAVHPQPLLPAGDYPAHLDRMYRAFGSFRTMAEVFHRLPSTGIWDDHEIRDGWGSHGDEHQQNEAGEWITNPELRPYFASAKEAFYRHFARNGRLIREPSKLEDGLQQSFTIGRTPVFLFDLRTQRNVNRQMVIDSLQMKDFEQWLDNLEDSSTVVIMSSIPLFWQAPDVMEALMSTMKQTMEDDITDSWSSEANLTQRNEIYRLLLEARVKHNILPVIISGDIHVGTINRVWYNDEDGSQQTLAYEMVVSGFAHKSLEDQSWGKQLGNLLASDGVLAEEIPVDGRNFQVSVEMQLSAAKLNFGAMEVYPDSSALHIFFRDRTRLSHLSLPLEWRGNFQYNTYSLQEIEGEAKASTFISGNKVIKQRQILQ